MTKTELISALRLCARKVEERDNVEIQLNIARRELAAVQAPPKLKEAGEKFSFLTFLIFGGIYLLNIGRGFRWIYAHLTEKLLLVLLLYLLIGIALDLAVSFLIGWIAYSIRVNKVNAANAALTAKFRENKQAKELRLLAECQRRQERLYHAQQEVTRCAQSCGLHENYQDSKPLIYLISYLETGRSDTLKEAINLYERELREDARDDAAARHRKEMQQKANAIYEETARSTAAAEAAARKADEAAFWGAAATLAASTQKKSSDPNDFRVV